MSKKSKEQLAIEALNAYMEGLNEKKLAVSDNNLLQLDNMIKTREVNGWAEKNAAVDRSKSQEERNIISNTAVRVRKKAGWKETWLKTIEQRNNDIEYQKNYKKGIDKRTADPDWQKKNAEKAKKAFKSMITPDGIFPSVKSCIEFYNKKRNSKYSESWLMTQRKKFPTEFYLISQEEYILITGIDPTI
jgi:hypothetical protein